MAFDVYSVSILGSVSGQPVANVLHAVDDVTGDADPIAGAAALNSGLLAGMGVIDKYLDCLPENYEMKALRTRRINNTGGPNVTSPNVAAGTRAGFANVSGVGPVGLFHANAAGGEVEWRTGKVFFPGVSSADVDNNIFVDTLITDIYEFLNGWRTMAIAGGGHNFSGCIVNTLDGNPLQIMAVGVSLKVGTQRRRYVPL